MVVPYRYSILEKGVVQHAYSIVDLVKSFRSLQWIVLWFLLIKKSPSTGKQKIISKNCSGVQAGPDVLNPAAGHQTATY